MRRKASITVFAALSLMLVAQLLFTLLEAARHYELQKVLYMNTDTVLESVFADYCSPLWETYKILGVRVDDTEGKLCFNNREAQLRGLTSDHLGSKEQKTLLSGMSLLTAEMDVNTGFFVSADISAILSNFVPIISSVPEYG